MERCELELIDEGEECRFSIKLHCQHGILKVHKLTYEPKKALSPAGNTDVPNMFSINAQTAQEWTEHFLSSSRNGDITFYCTPESCTAKSKDEDIAEGKGQIRKAIHTEVKIAMDNFREYSVVSESLLTFSLREFKATVTLAETLQVPLEIRFSDGDDPLYLRLKVESAIAAEFVVATSKGEKMTSHSGVPASSRPTPNERPAAQAIAVSRSASIPRQDAMAQKRRRRDSSTQIEDQSSSRPSGNTLGSNTNHAPPMASTPRNAAANRTTAETDTDDEESAALFFPGASQTSQQQLDLGDNDQDDSFEMLMQGVDQVPPTPLSKGGDPQEFAFAALTSQTTASQASNPELNSEQTGPRKRFQPLF